MKRTILTSAAVLCLVFVALAQQPFQNFRYGIRARYERPIRKTVLEKAQTLGDIIADYPVSWIAEYTSVEISVTKYNGKPVKVSGNGYVLTPAQKKVLEQAVLDAEVEINVYYKSQNRVTGTDSMHSGQIHIIYTVVPETEARFVGGEEQMKKYMGENGLDDIAKKVPDGFDKVAVKFTVDENGDITEAKVSQTSGNEKVDRLLLDAIQKMPRWQPAQNAQGQKVKQRFEFTAGKLGDGC